MPPSRFTAIKFYIFCFILSIFLFTNSHSSIATGLRFIRKEDGKVVTLFATDKMVTLRNRVDFKNFEEEWIKVLNENKISPHTFDERMNLLIHLNILTANPNDDTFDAKKQIPAKLHLAGRGTKPIAVTFTGSGNTMRDFAKKMRRKRRNWIRNRLQYNTMGSVVNRLDRSYRKMAKVDANNPKEIPSFRYFGGQAPDLFAMVVGRNQKNHRGKTVPDRPLVRRLRGHLYGAGYKDEAMRYLEQYFGPHNIEERKLDVLPELRKYTEEEALNHVKEAFRLNARSQQEGKFFVSENFDAYLLSRGEKAKYFRHEPEIEPRIAKRLYNKVPPVEIAKRLLAAGAWINDDKLTEDQKDWKSLAMMELQKDFNEREYERQYEEHIMNMFNIEADSPRNARYKQAVNKFNKLRRNTSSAGITAFQTAKNEPRPRRRHSLGHVDMPERDGPYRYTMEHSNRRKLKNTGWKAPAIQAPTARGG